MLTDGALTQHEHAILEAAPGQGCVSSLGVEVLALDEGDIAGRPLSLVDGHGVAVCEVAGSQIGGG